MATVNQAGAIVFRRDAGELRVLIVTAKQNPHHWIFPKGHIEPGETAEAAAVREAYEEAGVSGTIVASAGSSSFAAGRDTVVVEYFILATADAGGEREGRRLAWCACDEALAHLTFDDARQLLARAWPVMAQSSYR